MNRRPKTPCLIAATLAAWLSYNAIAEGQVPAVGGTIFQDLNNNTQNDAGEGLGGVALMLYADDGDMHFDINTDTLVDSMMTGAAGQYGFGSLDASKDYFVYQGAQDVGSLSILSSVSDLLDPLVETIMVDAFESQQRVEGNPVQQIGMTNLASSSSALVGGQRDLYTQYMSGPAEIVLHANPWGLNSVLQFDQSAGSMGLAMVTWDGPDNNMSAIPDEIGLGGMDLTTDGGEAFSFLAGIDEAGAGELLTLRVFSGTEVSTVAVPIPVTDGTATSHVIVPFSEFSGGASFDSVSAIQAEFGGHSPSIDAQLGPINIVTSATANMSVVAIPEPSAGLMAAISFMGLISIRKRRDA